MPRPDALVKNVLEPAMDRISSEASPTIGRTAKKTPHANKKEPTVQKRGIQVQISDDGVRSVQRDERSKPSLAPGAIDDVTRMIREKLKNLPSV
jgi:hypothetical protein